jgi:hypothetical protein
MAQSSPATSGTLSANVADVDREVYDDFGLDVTVAVLADQAAAACFEAYDAGGLSHDAFVTERKLLRQHLYESLLEGMANWREATE